jgi:RimJ/RimL family protein N-acetyltransferase
MEGTVSEPSVPGVIHLREVIAEDLDVFFDNQRDPEANRMAAFTAKDPSDREAFDRHWKRILADGQIILRTILYDDQVADSVLSYVEAGEREVSYWLGRKYWGKGIATQALTQYLDLVKERPLHARAAKDNLASLRVLDKCGFRISGEDRGYANARGEETEEYILILEESDHDR